MAQILKPIELGCFAIIAILGTVALVTELTQYEEFAKILVIPSLILLISVAVYSIVKTRLVHY